MAKDVITRFKLETTAYDSKLRDASKGLADYAKTATAAGKGFGKFTQSNVEAARALGNIAPSANNAKDKVKELVTAYNDMAKAYNALTKEQQSSDFGKAMAESLGKLKTQIAAAKQELYGMGDAMKDATKGFLSGDKLSGMLQVFGGNVMTKAAGMAAQFGTELVSCVQQGVELARQGEGIRVAFERLGRGDILQGLRDATHGTVTDLELMKAAVKFNDFKLPLDQLGTLLAFAQQKAKDTGQSVDYMVDSIVTGLGRKSLMILDNLGLSAAQVKERMAETGDMTKAVADIIKEEMSKSGDYIETAADRATRAEVDVQNAMENLGRTLLPLQEQGTQMWQSLQVGALNLLNEGLTPLVPKIVELKSDISELYDTVANNSVFNGLVNWMETGIDVSSRWIPKLRIIRSLLDFGKGNAAASGAGIGGIIADIPDQTINEIPEVVVTGTNPKKTTRRTGGSHRQSLRDSLLDSFNKNTSKFDASSLIDTSTGPSELWKMLKAQHDAELLKGMPTEADKIRFKNQYDETGEMLKNQNRDKDVLGDGKKFMNAISGLTSGLEQMGLTIPQEIKGLIGVVQGLMQVIESVNTIIGVTQTTALSANTAAIVSLEAAIWANTATSLFPGFARGGIVPHAQNGLNVVGGTHYSGDVTPILANAGEVVLNRSQVSTLASTLQGNGLQNMNLQAIVTGEQLRFILNTNSRRRGKGEYVTSTHQ